MAAVVDAATVLFAERGPRDVSIREIAARAGVNHGLVHRHFGSKQQVLRAVLDRIAGDLAASGGDMDDAGLRALFAALTRHETYWRALARAALEGELARDLQSGFPTIRGILAAFDRRQRDGAIGGDFDPRILTAGVAALVLGWLVFEPFVTAAARLDDGPRDETRAALLDTLLRILGRLHEEEPR